MKAHAEVKYGQAHILKLELTTKGDQTKLLQYLNHHVQNIIDCAPTWSYEIKTWLDPEIQSFDKTANEEK